MVVWCQLNIGLHRFWVRLPLEKMQFLIFSGNEVKQGVKFRHSTRNAFRIRRKVRCGVLCIGMAAFTYIGTCKIQREAGKDIHKLSKDFMSI